MHKFPQKLVNVPVRTSVNLDNYPEITRVVREVEQQMGSGGRVLLRSSGTEPLVRVMVEGEDMDQVDRMVKVLVGCVEQALTDQVA